VAIGESVTKDWKANASAGVAILKHNYDLVSLSEGQRASSEDVALAAYSRITMALVAGISFLRETRMGYQRTVGYGISIGDTPITER